MASPVVAGAAAVLLAYMPELKPEQVIESLVKSSNKAANGFDEYSEAGGVIDVAKAAEYAYNNYYQGNAAKTTPVKKKPALKKTVHKTNKL